MRVVLTKGQHSCPLYKVILKHIFSIIIHYNSRYIKIFISHTVYTIYRNLINQIINVLAYVMTDYSYMNHELILIHEYINIC